MAVYELEPSAAWRIRLPKYTRPEDSDRVYKDLTKEDRVMGLLYYDSETQPEKGVVFQDEKLKAFGVEFQLPGAQRVAMQETGSRILRILVVYPQYVLRIIHGLQSATVIQRSNILAQDVRYNEGGWLINHNDEWYGFDPIEFCAVHQDISITADKMYFIHCKSPGDIIDVRNAIALE